MRCTRSAGGSATRKLDGSERGPWSGSGSGGQRASGRGAGTRLPTTRISEQRQSSPTVEQPGQTGIPAVGRWSDMRYRTDRGREVQGYGPAVIDYSRKAVLLVLVAVICSDPGLAAPGARSPWERCRRVGRHHRAAGGRPPGGVRPRRRSIRRACDRCGVPGLGGGRGPDLQRSAAAAPRARPPGRGPSGGGRGVRPVHADGHRRRRRVHVRPALPGFRRPGARARLWRSRWRCPPCWSPSVAGRPQPWPVTAHTLAAQLHRGLHGVGGGRRDSCCASPPWWLWTTQSHHGGWALWTTRSHHGGCGTCRRRAHRARVGSVTPAGPPRSAGRG